MKEKAKRAAPEHPKFYKQLRRGNQMRIKKPRTATLNEVIISREGEYADIEFREPGISGMNLKLGPKVQKMTDKQILNAFNKTVRSMEEMRRTYVHRPVEIPDGKPQIKYFEAADQWVPRGDVLRCIVEDGGPDCEAIIWIDDHELSLREFGRLLTTNAGWGMRIVFVPDDELEKMHPIEIREPIDDPPGCDSCDGACCSDD
jgi:hypothetical protein